MELRPVHKVELLGGAGEGSIEPVDIVGGEHVVGHIALIQIDVRPLSALSFMAGDGIGKFHLKGIIVTIRLHLFDAFRREDEKKNRYIEGTGLGLSIVKQLTDLLDGETLLSLSATPVC